MLMPPHLGVGRQWPTTQTGRNNARASNEVSQPTRETTRIVQQPSVRPDQNFAGSVSSGKWLSRFSAGQPEPFCTEGTTSPVMVEAFTTARDSVRRSNDSFASNMFIW